MRNGTVPMMQRSTSTLGYKAACSRKAVVVGDGETGKTSLLFVFSKNSYPQAYVPTVLETQVLEVIPTADVNQAQLPPVELTVWDTAGQEDYDRLRPLAYGNTDVFIVCYSVDNHNSYANVSQKWVPELRHFSPRTPIVLVATKTDLRYDAYCQKEMASRGQAPISTMQGHALAQQIQAQTYVECSVQDRDTVHTVFQTAATIALYSTNTNKKPRPCTIL